MLTDEISLFFMAGWPENGQVIADKNAVLVYYPREDRQRSILTLAHAGNDNNDFQDA